MDTFFVMCNAVQYMTQQGTMDTFFCDVQCSTVYDTARHMCRCSFIKTALYVLEESRVIDKQVDSIYENVCTRRAQ